MDQQHGLLSPPELSPLEQQVLEEYERLATNMKTLATLLGDLSSNPTVGILDGLRELERKTSLAFTLLKASVYSIVLQQEIDWGAGGEEQEQKQEGELKEEEEEEEEL
ncbi:DASH complex subunit Dad3 domain-containing protein [Trichoderma chlorosporum]